MSYFKSSEISERNRFTEQTIEAAYSVLEGSNISVTQNGHTVRLSQIASGLFIPDYTQGNVNIPDGADASGDNYPIVALPVGDTLRMGSAFNYQTQIQRDNTIQKLQKWEPTQTTPEEWVDKILPEFSNQSNQGMLIRQGEENSASVTCLSAVADFNHLREQGLFNNLPDVRLARFLLRPLIVIKYNEASKHVQQQVVAHELAHLIQKTRNPVRVFGSQKSVNMQALRDEIAAYHVGALTKRKLDALEGVETLPGEDMQLTVDNIRSLVNKNALDPFQASPKLLKMLQKLGSVLHGSIDFDQVVGSLDEQA